MIAVATMRIADGDYSLLSADERARAAALATDAARAFVAGRTLLRRMLGDELAIDPRSLRLDVDARGRPRVVDHPRIDFNLSHGGDWVMVAIGRGHRVGVDIEPRHPPRDVAAILAALELAPLPELGFADRWARIEALCKLSGRGLTIPIDPDDITAAAGVTLVDLELDDDHAAALAWTAQETYA